MYTILGYLVICMLGHSSTVFQGRYRSADGSSQLVAVKKLLMHAGNVKQTLHEVKITSQCRHPNIVQYIGYFRSGGLYLNIVTEYMAGGDLESLLKTEHVCTYQK